ncbi:unnamed protein product [Ambrosiozyma monospora]|uniref:Unnamed protein product n=1 Tax=Ambrosiozyma monospora TaxID=43982 RepID=A0ACB5TKR8_AMBMO|nr:unnamed protein product [Ambrosiozyma monospora]
MEIEEPNILARGYQIHEIEKLLHGAKEARLLKSEATLGYDELTAKKIESEEAEKREIIRRILTIKNASNKEKEDLLTALAVKEFARFEGDTGSSEVQAAVMTVDLYNLMDHVKKHPQDLVHIRKARMLTQKRQRILRYLKRDNPERYFYAIEKLGLTDEVVHAEFNFDKQYMQDFNIWPGRNFLKVSEAELEAKKRQKRAEKKAVRRALSQRSTE